MLHWIKQLLAPILQRQPLGDRGEAIAARHLRKLGFKVLIRNYRVRGGEIDIIARQGNLLIFVEVKTRQSDDFAPPYRQVTFRKQKRLKRAAGVYMAHYDHRPQHRFDIVSIVWPDQGQPQIEHIPAAF